MTHSASMTPPPVRARKRASRGVSRPMAAVSETTMYGSTAIWSSRMKASATTDSGSAASPRKRPRSAPATSAASVAFVVSKRRCVEGAGTRRSG